MKFNNTLVRRAIFILLVLPYFSIAQSSFKPGSLVTLKGDTLKGFISISENENNPKYVNFRPDVAGAPVRYRANEIRWFNITGLGHLAEYQAYVGPVSTDITDTYKIAIGRDTSYRQDTVFLKLLQKGTKLLLFSHLDDQKKRFFISGGYAETPVELVYRVWWNSAEANGKDRTDYENAFKGQLYDHAVKTGTLTPAINAAIKNAEYNERDILKIAALINGISEKDPAKNNVSTSKRVTKHILIFGLIAVAVIELSLLTFTRGG